MHNLGKLIVIAMLRASAFEVLNLGEDALDAVEKAKQLMRVS